MTSTDGALFPNPLSRRLLPPTALADCSLTQDLEESPIECSSRENTAAKCKRQHLRVRVTTQSWFLLLVRYAALCLRPRLHVVTDA